MPADYIIDNEELFVESVRRAFDYIEQNDVLLTFGVVPTRPDTNYGYAQVCGGRDALHSKEPVKVKTFTEKPDRELANIFLASGEFLWNAAILLWRADTFRQEMEKHMPQVTNYFKGWELALGTPVEHDFVTKAFSECMNISLAYGVMEKTDRAWISPVQFRWNDAGTWESLYNIIKKEDDYGNACNLDKTLIEDTKNTLVISPEKKKLVAIKGLEDYMVVDTDDVLIICPKDDKKFKEFISGIAMPDYEKYR
jgi:mannose-1-phosphate guanylyltransferase